MFDYLKKKWIKHKAKTKFAEYDSKIVTFNVPGYGEIKYAQWLNPLERPKEITTNKIDFFKKFLKPGDFAIDIGAHTGDTPIPISLATGAQGTVLALEPNPLIFKILEVNASLNTGKTNIIPLNVAATKTDGDFFYNSSEASFNNGGISSEQTAQHGKYSLPTKVKGINLTSYLKKNHADKLSRLRFIKIDTEGYDFEIIKSIDDLIGEFKPAIVFECFRKLTMAEREQLYESIAKHGYKLFYFEDFDVNGKTLEIGKKDMMNWKHFDIYAIPN